MKVTSLVFLMGCCALAGCAAQTPTTTAVAPAGANLSSGAQATTTASAATDHKPIPAGYTRTVVNGIEKFCRVDTYTGSRTQKTQVCLTRAQLDDQQNESQSFIQDVERRSAGATQNTTPGAGGAGGH